MSHTKKKLLITGSTGFVGSHFIQSYSDEYDIHTLSFTDLNPNTHHDSNKVEEFRTLYKDIDCIVHFAALVHQMKGADEEEYFKINYEKTKTLTELAKAAHIPHFIFMSTAHVYGDSGSFDHKHKPLNEFSNCNPTDPYGKSKLLAEEYLNSQISPTFKVSHIRPPMVYGSGGKGNLILLAKLIRLLPLLPFNFNQNKRSMVNVKNLIYLVKILIDQPINGIFIPLDQKNYSLFEIIQMLSQALQVKNYLFNPEFILLPLIKFFAPKYAVRLFGTLALENRWTCEKTNYKPIFTTQEGLTEMFKK